MPFEFLYDPLASIGGGGPNLERAETFSYWDSSGEQVFLTAQEVANVLRAPIGVVGTFRKENDQLHWNPEECAEL